MDRISELKSRIQDIGIDIYYKEKEIQNLESERAALEVELSIEVELHGN